MFYREEVSEKTFGPAQLDPFSGTKMEVANDSSRIVLQRSAFVSQTDFLYCEVYGLSEAQPGTMKTNCWGSSEFCLMSYCSSTLTWVILSRDFIGCKHATWQLKEHLSSIQGKGLLMSWWIQWVSAWLVTWYFKPCFGFLILSLKN